MGKRLIDNIELEVASKIFLDIDFKDRTVLKIITSNSYIPLMQNEKVSIILGEVWVGKPSFECDGKMEDFSLLTFMLNNHLKRLPGKNISIKELISSNFRPDINDKKFWF